MKKTIILLLCAAALFMSLAGCGAKNVTFTGTIEEIAENSILVTTSDDVGFDKANVTFKEGTKISFNFLVGQVVKITIQPEIRESYPVQVTAVAIELVSAPASPDPERPDYTASFYRADSKADGGWDFITTWADNADTLSISSVRHIPVVVITDLQALSDFLEEGINYFQFDVAYGENESFLTYTEKYDAAFFENKTLLILCTQETSGSISHKIKDVTLSDSTLSAAVEAIVPEVGTDDMADWFIPLELSNDEISGATKFDAYYAAD